MCSNASITEILGINDKNLVILGNKKETKIAISICTLFVLPAKISELDLKYMSRLGLAYSF